MDQRPNPMREVQQKIADRLALEEKRKNYPNGKIPVYNGRQEKWLLCVPALHIPWVKELAKANNRSPTAELSLLLAATIGAMRQKAWEEEQKNNPKETFADDEIPRQALEYRQGDRYIIAPRRIDGRDSTRKEQWDWLTAHKHEIKTERQWEVWRG